MPRNNQISIFVDAGAGNTCTCILATFNRPYASRRTYLLQLERPIGSTRKDMGIVPQSGDRPDSVCVAIEFCHFAIRDSIPDTDVVIEPT
jgi:hypothetical protein